MHDLLTHKQQGIWAFQHPVSFIRILNHLENDDSPSSHRQVDKAWCRLILQKSEMICLITCAIACIYTDRLVTLPRFQSECSKSVTLFSHSDYIEHQPVRSPPTTLRMLGWFHLLWYTSIESMSYVSKNSKNAKTWGAVPQPEGDGVLALKVTIGRLVPIPQALHRAEAV